MHSPRRAPALIRRTADSARRCVAAGTSVTIGLPSWLTNKENELAILVAYFLVIIIVIPVVVGLWWRNSSK